MTKVYIVFSNHLDVGYTDNLNGSCAGSVVNRYFDDHFPLAIKTVRVCLRSCVCANASMWYMYTEIDKIKFRFGYCNIVNQNVSPHENSVR